MRLWPAGILALMMTARCCAADMEMSGPSVGPSDIGLGKADDGTFKFVNTKTQQVIGDLELGKVPDASVHASWNKSGTRVEVLVVLNDKRRAFHLYQKTAEGGMNEIKFDTPDAIALCEAKTKKPVGGKASEGADCSDLGMWTDDNTSWFITGVTRPAEGGAGHVTVMATFSVKLTPAGPQVGVESVIGPLKDDASNTRRDEFLQNWEQRNAIGDSVLQ